MKTEVLRFRIVLMLQFVLSLLIFQCGCIDHEPQDNRHDHESISDVKYVILKDTYSDNIEIGVPYNIRENQLRAILKKAADDHQDDPPRDYYISDNLFIIAFLYDGKKTSSKPVGSISRYVPARNPKEGKPNPTEKVLRSDIYMIELHN